MSKQTESVPYLDGIRGLAAFGVFLNHFSLAFYFAWYNQKIAASHLNGLEIDYTQSLFSFINNGGYCVSIFFVLSGLVLSRKYFLSDNVEVLVSGLHRRFLRLYIPIAVTLILSYILLSSGLYFNDATSRITLSEWFIKLWRMPDPQKQLVSDLFYGTMFKGENSFDTCLWTISNEFYGSLFVYAFLIFTHYTKRYRLLMMFLAMFYFYVMSAPFYLAFVLGMTLNYTEEWIKRNRSMIASIIAVVLVIVSLLLGTIRFGYTFDDTWQNTIKTTIWDYTPWATTIGAYFLILAFVISPLLQKIMSFRPFRFLGYISFSFYLLHPILIGSFSSWLFLKQYSSMGYNQAVLLVFLTTTALLMVLSWLMAKYIDQFGIRLARRAYEYVRNPSANPPAGSSTGAKKTA